MTPQYTPVGAALEGERVDPGVLQRLPRRLQHHPLLRVDVPGLARRHAEQVRVELGGVVQEGALPRDGPAGSAGLRVVESLDVPAAVGGERGDGVAALGQQPPERSGESAPPG
ncbi:hypothetical protein GCM10020295_07880 [Streptomyces cinereospinus]